VSPRRIGRDAFGDCDFHAPIATLAGLLRPSVASFPAKPTPLLCADAAREERFRERSAAMGESAWRSRGAAASQGARGAGVAEIRAARRLRSPHATRRRAARRPPVRRDER
jgi:hypothetical protein